MNRFSSILLAVTLAVAVCTPALADLCPPVPYGPNDTCSCDVRNYGTKPDTDVAITVFSDNNTQICPSVTVQPSGIASCSTPPSFFGYCGCTVAGESSKTRASLSAIPFGEVAARVTVSCN